MTKGVSAGGPKFSQECSVIRAAEMYIGGLYQTFRKEFKVVFVSDMQCSDFLEPL